MKRETEIQLIEEMLSIHAQDSAYLEEQQATNLVAKYMDEEHFQREFKNIFSKLPAPILLSSELEKPNAFLRRMVAGMPVIFTRDSDGQVHAFKNVCRHRGAELVGADKGCQKRFSCPYHAWTWNNRGDLVGVPHGKLGFPNMTKENFALQRLGCVEKYGWIWVTPDSDQATDVDEFLAGLADDFKWLAAENLVVQHRDEVVCMANWKVLIEGGIEAYHFKVTHRDTIAPHFPDNLSSYQCFGPHIRSYLPKNHIFKLDANNKQDWDIRQSGQLIYSIFATNQLLIQADHISWIQLEPRSAGETLIRLSSLVPSDRLESEADLSHWARNHKITADTLAEDFAMGEGIQRGIAAGANEDFTYGLYEGAIVAHNQTIDKYLNH